MFTYTKNWLILWISLSACSNDGFKNQCCSRVAPDYPGLRLETVLMWLLKGHCLQDVQYLVHTLLMHMTAQDNLLSNIKTSTGHLIISLRNKTSISLVPSLRCVQVHTLLIILILILKCQTHSFQLNRDLQTYHQWEQGPGSNADLTTMNKLTTKN